MENERERWIYYSELIKSPDYCKLFNQRKSTIRGRNEVLLEKVRTAKPDEISGLVNELVINNLPLIYSFAYRFKRAYSLTEEEMRDSIQDTIAYILKYLKTNPDKSWGVSGEYFSVYIAYLIRRGLHDYINYNVNTVEKEFVYDEDLDSLKNSEDIYKTEKLEFEEFKVILKYVMNLLPERERDICILVIFGDVFNKYQDSCMHVSYDNGPWTFEECSELFRVSKERIRLLYFKSMKRLEGFFLYHLPSYKQRNEFNSLFSEYNKACKNWAYELDRSLFD